MKIANDNNINEISVYYDYGMSKENLSDDKTYFCRMQLFGYDINALKNSGINISNGRFPQNSKEIIVSKNGALNINGGKKIGDEVELTFEEKTKKYKIVGFAENIEGDGFSNFAESRYGAITFLEDGDLQSDTIVNLSILTLNINQIYQTTNNLEKNLKLYEIPNTSKVTNVDTYNIETFETFKNRFVEMGIDIEGLNFSIETDSAESITEEKVEYNKELLECLGVYEGENTPYLTFISIRNYMHNDCWSRWDCTTFLSIYDNL